MAYDNEKIIAEAMEHFNHLVNYNTDGKLNEDNNLGMPQQDAQGQDNGGMPQDPMQGGAPAPSDNQQGAEGQPGDDSQASQGVPGLQPQGGDGQMGQQDASQPEQDDSQELDFEPEQPEQDGRDNGGNDEISDKLDKFQEETSAEINSMKGSFDELKSLLSRFESGLQTNQDGIEMLKKELEKRAPDSVEKMGLRREKSGPFTDTPDNYWNTEAPDNYSAEDDMDGVGDERYKITGKDIDDITDWNEISKSLNGKDDDLDKSLSGIFGL